jgi:hypothetical protein
VCCITADPRRKSTIRVPASDAIFSTKSQPHHLGGQHSFCGRSALLCLMRNFEQGLHQPSASTPTPTFNGARASGTVVSNGAAAHSSSSSLPSPQAHAPQGPAAAAAPARAAPTAGTFDGVHSIPGHLVDLLTRNGIFAFLEDLHTTGRQWNLRNFRIPRLVPRGTARSPKSMLQRP